MLDAMREPRLEIRKLWMQQLGHSTILLPSVWSRAASGTPWTCYGTWVAMDSSSRVAYYASQHSCVGVGDGFQDCRERCSFEHVRRKVHVPLCIVSTISPVAICFSLITTDPSLKRSHGNRTSNGPGRNAPIYVPCRIAKAWDGYSSCNYTSHDACRYLICLHI